MPLASYRSRASHALRGLAALACALSLALAAVPVASAPLGQLPAAFLPDEVLIKVDPAASPNALAACLRSASAARQRDIAHLHISRLKVPNGRTAETIARLRACPGILYAEPNYVVTEADTLPNDPGWTSQYGLTNIRAPQGWDISTGSNAVTIAIVDSGIDLAHADLADKIVAGYDFVNADTVAQDDNGHGTHVAGIAAASTNNGIGVAGVSWGARLMPVKVLNASGNGNVADVASGITWAADHGAQVINLSLQFTSPSTPVEDAINYAYGLGVTIVAAAGNIKVFPVVETYPARYNHVLSVAATDSNNVLAPFSIYGPNVDLAAPGVAIYSTWLGGGYQNDSGTSMAAPFVSGLAAILRGLPGNASPDQITRELQDSALDLGTAGWDQYFGYGLIQVDAAIESVVTLSLSLGGSGTGTVTSSPGGIDCGATCLAGFARGTSVTLTAHPDARMAFAGWSDPACPGTGPCTLSLSASQSLTATFIQLHYLYLPLIFR